MLLDEAFVDLGRTGETGTQGLAGEERQAVFNLTKPSGDWEISGNQRRWRLFKWNARRLGRSGRRAMMKQAVVR